MGQIITVPVEWIGREYLGTPLGTLPHASFVRDVLAGKVPQTTEYAGWLGGEATKHRMFSLSEDGDAARLLEHRVRRVFQEPSLDPLHAHLVADGMYLLADGHHRACRMLAEGVRSLQLDVRSVATEWGNLVTALRGIYGGQELYEDVEHPHFASWHVHRDKRRTEAVQAHCRAFGSAQSSVALDLGCCTGRFSRELARLGYDVEAVDCDPVVVRIGERLNQVFSTRAKVRYTIRDVREFIRDYRPRGPIGCALVLSLFHHWLSTPEGLADIKTTLRRLDALGAGSILVDVPVAGQDDWTRSCIPLSDVRDLYRQALPGRAVIDIGIYDSRPLLAFVRS